MVDPKAKAIATAKPVAAKKADPKDDKPAADKAPAAEAAPAADAAAAPAADAAAAPAADAAAAPAAEAAPAAAAAPAADAAPAAAAETPEEAVPKIESREGQKVPDVKLLIEIRKEPVFMTSDDIFKGKKVVVFALPGAFTPTCSSAHLPRYEELYDTLRAQGVDEVYCLSVNDCFVFKEWFVNQGITKVKYLPDGNCEFTKGMGAAVDKAALCFGMRSWRYSMLVDDGVVTKQFIEPDKAGDPFEVSDADTMLKYLAPDAKAPKAITMLSRAGCLACTKAKAFLAEKQLRYNDVPVANNGIYRGVTKAKPTSPQIFIDGELVGGFSDLVAWYDKEFGAAAEAPAAAAAAEAPAAAAEAPAAAAEAPKAE